MRRLAVCVAWACVAASAMPARAATLPGPAFPTFQSAAALQAHCDNGLGRAKAALRALERRSRRCPVARRVRRPQRTDGRLGRARSICCPTCTRTRRSATPPTLASCAGRTSPSSLGQNATLYAAATRLDERDPINALLLKTLARRLRRRRRQPAACAAQASQGDQRPRHGARAGVRPQHPRREHAAGLFGRAIARRARGDVARRQARRPGPRAARLRHANLHVGDAGRSRRGDARAHVARQDQ